MGALEGRTAVVTGASSGIGRATARALAAEGARLFVAGRDAERTEETARSIREAGGKAAGEAFQITDSGALRAFVDRAASETGRLDVMVNAAGVNHLKPIADADPAEWAEMLDTNIIAVLVGCQAAIRAMRETSSKGHIVNISSVAAKRDNSNVYGATKAAVNVITGTLRDELEDEPIRVVSVMPGVVGTNFGRTFRPETVNGLLAAVGMPATYKSGDIFGDDTVAELNRRAASIFASPDDIARAVLFAVTQPHDLNVLELVVRPRKQIPIAG